MILIRRLLLILLCMILPAAHAACAEPAGFLCVADLHLTTDAQESWVLSAVREKAAGCSAVLFLGDNTNNGKAEEHTAFLAYLRTLAEDGTKVYVVPGNHDLSGSTAPEVFRKRYHAFGYDEAFLQDETSLSYAVMAGDACLLVIDTNDDTGSRSLTPRGGIRPGVMDFAARVVSALPEGTPVIACGHHPLFPYVSDYGDVTENAEAFAGELARLGVRIWLCGHRHGHAAQSAEGIRQIIVGMPGGYPAWTGSIAAEADGSLHYTAVPLLDPESDLYRELRDGTLALGLQMGTGSLTGTAYEGDEAAAAWFAEAFVAQADGTLAEKREALLADENCEKWRRADVRSVTRQWMLELLEQSTEDVRDILISPNGIH